MVGSTSSSEFIGEASYDPFIMFVQRITISSSIDLRCTLLIISTLLLVRSDTGAGYHTVWKKLYPDHMSSRDYEMIESAISFDGEFVDGIDQMELLSVWGEIYSFVK